MRSAMSFTAEGSASRQELVEIELGLAGHGGIDSGSIGHERLFEIGLQTRREEISLDHPGFGIGQMAVGSTGQVGPGCRPPPPPTPARSCMRGC